MSLRLESVIHPSQFQALASPHIYTLGFLALVDILVHRKHNTFPTNSLALFECQEYLLLVIIQEMLQSMPLCPRLRLKAHCMPVLVLVGWLCRCSEWCSALFSAHSGHISLIDWAVYGQ